MPTLLSLEALEADRHYVQRQLNEIQPNPWGTAKLMWESRLADIDREIAALAASRSNYASVALIFDGLPVIGESNIRLDFATDALDEYQRLVTLALASRHSEESPHRGPISEDRSRLFIRDLARGSVGFILEEIAPKQKVMFPTELKDAVEESTLLLATLSTATDEIFESTLETTPPKLVAAVQRFAKILYEAGASTRIVGDQHRLVLSADDVGHLSRRLNEVEVSEEVEPTDGILLGILPESRQFELKLQGDEAETIKGAISKELAFKYTADVAFKERLLLRPIRAQITFVRTTRNGKIVRERRVLESVEASADV